MLPGTVITQKGKSYTILIKDDKLTPVQCLLDDGKNKYELDLKNIGAPARPMAMKGLTNQKVSDI